MSTECTPTVLSEFAELLPPLSEEQLATLEADILQNGCYAPIIINEDMVVIDGHHRLQICEKHSIPYRMTVFSFEDELEAKQWALDTQKSRRNLSKWELGQIALKLKPDIEAKARENQGQRNDLSMKSDEGFTPIDTRQALADSVGISRDTMSKVMRIEGHAPVPVKEALDNKEISINQGYNITRELEDMTLEEEEKEYEAMKAVEREIERKFQERTRMINDKTRIAQNYCKGFEYAALMKVTDENTAIWVEQSGVLYDQPDNTIREAREIAEDFLRIADFLEKTIKPNH